MKKFMVLLKRKARTTPEQFRNHYESNHIPLGEAFIGHLLARFSRHYPGVMADFSSDDRADGRRGRRLRP